MKFTPQKYSIADQKESSFIDPAEIEYFLSKTESSDGKVQEILTKSLAKQRLTLEEVAVLLNTREKKLTDQVKQTANVLKNEIYGNRIVLFAPLYIGNKCSNDCSYCGFRTSNFTSDRITLSEEEIIESVEAIQKAGHKRAILVFGEHREYSPEFISDSVKLVYNTKSLNNAIRRININAAPFDVAGFETIKKAGIGTYQIFQETYHEETYKKYHKSGKKADYENRLVSLDRAMIAGIDDVGLGVLFGLYDWKYEVLSLVRHVNHLEACFNIGPHTISFPRVQKALGSEVGDQYKVSDEDFTKLVAILRLAVPYAGLILTAREPAHIRDEVIKYGCSQIDAGTNIEMKGYISTPYPGQKLENEQFLIGDQRSLRDMIEGFIDKDMLPSFCTACYRTGRTGEHFMEIAVPGFIHNFCTPNAILTFAEYLEDYALDPEKKIKAYSIIEKAMNNLEKTKFNVSSLKEKLQLIQSGQRDLYY